MLSWLVGVLCKGVSCGITTSTSTVTKTIINNSNNFRSELYADKNINTLESDWSYLFMPEPIVGGTKHIEDMYND